MRFTAAELSIPDVFLVSPRRFEDTGGYFMETYRAREFEQLGLQAGFVQDNQAMSKEAGTICGLHFQAPPNAQAKLVRAVSGAIFDVAVDLRRGSPTFGKWVGAKLTAEAGKQLYVPTGFAHGYCTLQPNTTVAYKCDSYSVAGAERGILFSDPAIGIEWPVAADQAILSDKDLDWPLLEDVVSPFALEML